MSTRYVPKRAPLDACPVEEVFAMVSGKWKVRILYLLHVSPRGFGELQRELGSVSREVLSNQLDSLAECGLLAAPVAAKDGTSTRYMLAPDGERAVALLQPIATWGEELLRRRGEDWRRPTAR